MCVEASEQEGSSVSTFLNIMLWFLLVGMGEFMFDEIALVGKHFLALFTLKPLNSRMYEAVLC